MNRPKPTNAATITKMLNSMAFSNLSYMTPTRSRARPATITGRDCGADYFASSADFEYDLFLHGLVTCDSAFDSATSTSAAGTGFFSRYRSSRPFYGSSSPAASTSFHGRQPSSSVRSNHSLQNALSITSLNRSSFNEQYYHDDRHGDISSQQHRMKNMLASNLSLGNSVPLNTCTTAATVGATNLRPAIAEETNKKHRSQQKAKASNLVDHLESENVDNLSHQQLHALHRFRRQKKKGFLSRLRDVVISFTPKARLSIVNRHDIFVRFGKEEKDALACFDYLDKLPIAEDSAVTPSAFVSGDESTTSAAAGDQHDLSLVAIKELLGQWQKESWSATPTSCDTSTTTTYTAPAVEGISNKMNNTDTTSFDSNSGQTSQVGSILDLAAMPDTLNQSPVTCSNSTPQSGSGNSR